MTKEQSNSESTKKPLAWMAGVVLVVGLAVVAGLLWSSSVKVNKIAYEGNHFTSKKELRAVEVPTNVAPDSVDFAKVTRRFEELPYVKRAEVNVEPSGKLIVEITERSPIAMLTMGGNKAYADANGIRLPMIKGQHINVPILYGFKTEPMSDTLTSDAFKRTADFLVNVKGRPVSNATISEVAWTTKKGIVALTNKNGVKLTFGKGDFKKRLRNWEAFYGKVIKSKGINHMRSVDLRFEGQVVTREKGT